MVKATWRILALSALMGAVALPASAQVVVGESGRPSVEVNWAVLDSLGRQPNLADMLKDDMAGTPAAAKPPGTFKAPGAAKSQQGVAYRPYKPQPEKSSAKPAVRKAVAEAKKPAITPVSTKDEVGVTQLVRAAQKAEPAKAPEVKADPVKAPEAKAEIKSAEPAIPAGPQIALPEIKPTPVATIESPAPVAASPAPAAAPPAAAPMQIAKVEAPVPVPAPASVIAAPALTPAPQPAVKPEPVAVPQVAAVPAAVANGDTTAILFSGEDAKLPAGALTDLRALAKRMEKDDGLGLQLLAYAAGDDSGASKARRLSLSRALEVRKFLMEQGVRSTRIEVRALGNKLEGAGPADRVDAVVVNR